MDFVISMEKKYANWGKKYVFYKKHKKKSVLFQKIIHSLLLFIDRVRDKKIISQLVDDNTAHKRLQKIFKHYKDEEMTQLYVLLCDHTFHQLWQVILQRRQERPLLLAGMKKFDKYHSQISGDNIDKYHSQI